MKTNLKKCSLNDLLFPVEMVECTDFQCNNDYQYDIFAYPNGEKIRVNVCSDRYQLIPNNDIFPVIEQILVQNDVQFTADYSMINHSRFYVEYIIENPKFAYPIGNGDVVKPCIKVQHSYNGLTKYSITVGFFRLVCTNGLVIAIEDMKEFNLNIVGKHTENIKNSLNRLEQSLTMFEENSSVLQTIINKYQMLNSVPIVNLKQAIETTLKNSGITAVDNKSLNTVDSIYNRITAELNNPTIEFNGATNWILYNGINSYIFDDNLNIATPDIRTAKDQTVFEYLLAESKKYLTLETV